MRNIFYRKSGKFPVLLKTTLYVSFDWKFVRLKTNVFNKSYRSTTTLTPILSIGRISRDASVSNAQFLYKIKGLQFAEKIAMLKVEVMVNIENGISPQSERKRTLLELRAIKRRRQF